MLREKSCNFKRVVIRVITLKSSVYRIQELPECPTREGKRKKEWGRAQRGWKIAGAHSRRLPATYIGYTEKEREGGSLAAPRGTERDGFIWVFYV